MSSGLDEVRGSVEPRIWTPSLVELTPETSYGFDVIQFAAETLGAPLDPWQEWVVIHAGELLEDGRPRFRKVLILVARQNGKTHLLVVLALYWLYVECVELILGTSTKLDYARESWEKACKMARRVTQLAAEIPERGGIRRTNGEQSLWRASAAEVERGEGSRYKIAASNAEGGRSLTVHRLVLDELRQHHDYSAYDASVPATSAVAGAQIFGLSNAGSDRSVVLNDLREEAVRFIQEGVGDPRLGIFEYSATEGASPTDLGALAQANPNLGYRSAHSLDPAVLLGDAEAAVAKGGEKLAGFRTEHMCIRVSRLDPAVDPEKWLACDDPGTMDDLRDRIALCVDLAPDEQHATLVAAAVMDDGRVRVEVVAAWSGAGCTSGLRRALPGLVDLVGPRALGWFPSGPAAAVAVDLADRDGWPPDGVTVTEIRGEVTACCMGLAEMVGAEQVAHSGDPMLTAHVTGSERLRQGDAWRFARRGAGHVDGAYACAGAVHLARTLPVRERPMPPPMIV